MAANSNSSVKHSTNSTNNISEKEQRKENKEREREIREREKEKEKESTDKVITIKESKRDASKESKRDKDEGEVIRKRDRGEKRRDREKHKITEPPSYYNDRYDDPRAVSPQFYDRRSPDPNDRFHGADGYNDERADRDLSSISNSSKGSTNRRSQESPDNERELKRRRLENSKVNAPNFVHLQFSIGLFGRLKNSFGIFCSITEKRGCNNCFGRRQQTRTGLESIEGKA